MEEWSKRKKGSANKWPTPEFATYIRSNYF